MKNYSFLFILLLAGLLSCKPSNSSETAKVKTQKDYSIKNSHPEKALDDKDIYSKYDYRDSNGKRVIIQNGYPRGGIKYTDPEGKAFAYAVFWTRIINETATPLEVNIDFPINQYEISNYPGKYFKVLVPSDTMTPDKISLFNYGLTSIDSFLDHNIQKPSSLKRTINPNESSGFYFIMLIKTEEATGMTRTELKLKGQELYYTISLYSSKKPITLIDEKEVRCGSINLTNLKLHQ